MNQLRACLFILFFIIYSVAACTHTEKRVEKTVSHDTKEDDKVLAHLASRKPELDSQEKLAYLIRKKNYSKALNAIKKDIDGGKKEITYIDDYALAINERIAEGKKRQKEEDFEGSGLIFSSVIAMYPKMEALRSRVNEKPGKLVAYIDVSSEKLMEDGMSQYRDGNLGNAIKIWRKILKFNPYFEEAKKAIETATVQLNNLKSLQRKGK
jgi:tetratricopeptide (TPR) repeat protein